MIKDELLKPSRHYNSKLHLFVCIFSLFLSHLFCFLSCFFRTSIIHSSNPCGAVERIVFDEAGELLELPPHSWVINICSPEFATSFLMSDSCFFISFSVDAFELSLPLIPLISSPSTSSSSSPSHSVPLSLLLSPSVPYLPSAASTKSSSSSSSLSNCSACLNFFCISGQLSAPFLCPV